MGSSTGVHGPLRSYHPRRRGLPEARQRAFEERLAQWSIGPDGPRLDEIDAIAAFDDVVLDIGFGGGEGLVAMALAAPDVMIIGADVHTPGVALVLAAVADHDLVNVRVVHGDVLDMLHRIPLGWLSGVRIWFPDPWPKPKQRKRRLVRDDVVDALAQRLRSTDAGSGASRRGSGPGWIHVATDHADYARAAAATLDAHPLLTGGVIERPEWRPLTRFERRGLDEGRPAVDLWYDRRAWASSLASVSRLDTP